MCIKACWLSRFIASEELACHRQRNVDMGGHIYLVALLAIFSSTLSSVCGRRYAGNNLTAGVHDYGQVLSLQLYYYEAQRSGKLPSDKRIPWRRDSLLYDVGLHGEDLSGGYYIREIPEFSGAKFGYPTAAVATMLGWGLLDYRAGYEKAGELDDGRAALKWATDYLIKCHTAPNELYAFVGTIRGSNWGRPDDYEGPRPAYKITPVNPGSDFAAETAAALAVASMVFRNLDALYAHECLKHAKELYDVAVTYRGNYSESISPLEATYISGNGYGDELAWAAAWLYQAADNASYLADAKRHYEDFSLADLPSWMSYAEKIPAVQVLLAKLTNEERYREAVQRNCHHMAHEAMRTPKGLVHVSAGAPLSQVTLATFLCMQATDFEISTENYYDFAREQIGYILGDAGQSFVVGYGKNSPKRPFHMGSCCPHRPDSCGPEKPSGSEPNPQVLYGALVRGPGALDEYEDTLDEQYNLVSMEWNVGLTSSLAALNSISG